MLGTRLDVAGVIETLRQNRNAVLLTSDKSLPRRLDAIGRIVDALHEFLSQHHDQDSCRNRVRWLGAARP